MKNDDARLTVKQVSKRVRRSRGTIWRLIIEGAFPAPLRYGPKGGRIYWYESDIAAWLEKQ
jgi:predicted DNA-binding transcriptional regulator AlpA